ncbi:MAG: preprotein translocase subunit YajC [Gammaproteobacteria bacterium]|nr:preprotein translocase subunit YajC [Gammaproteobacteria bacterium]
MNLQSLISQLSPINDAWAQGAGGGGGLVGLLPFLLIIVIFYLLLIRPQQKRAKQHKQMISELAKGDEVVTNGGALGKITGVDDNFITLEIADGVRIKVQRMAVAQMMPKGTIKGE